MEELVTAFLLLQEAGFVGMDHLCHPTKDEYNRLCNLTLCATTDAGTTATNDDYETVSHRYLMDPVVINNSTSVTTQNDMDDAFVTQNIIGALVTVCGIAMAAGLFLGLMTLDVLDLQIIIRSSVDENDVKYAQTLLPIVQNRHRLLVTLLLMNTVAYETLPIFLDRIMSGWVAVILSTSLVLVFGEIFPSGIFTGPHQLYLSYRLAPLVNVCLTLLYPVAYPLGKLLDWMVDEDESDKWYDRSELSALIKIQYEQRTKVAAARAWRTSPSTLHNQKYIRNKDRQWNDVKQEILEKVTERNETLEYLDDDEFIPATEQLAPPLHPRELDMVEGSLSMKTKIAMDVYTPLKHVYAVPHDLALDKRMVTEIYGRGFSRVPIYQRRDVTENHNGDGEEDISAFLGYLMTRKLMLIDWEDSRLLETMPLQRPTCVSPRINLVDLLKLMQTQGRPLTFVCARPDLANKALRQMRPIPVEAGLLGLVTIVDILESVLQDKIYDETDIRDRNLAVATLQNWAAEKLQMFMRRRKKRRSQSRDIPDGASVETIHSVGTHSDDDDLERPTEQSPLLRGLRDGRGHDDVTDMA